MINHELLKSFIQRHLKITIIVALAAGVLSFFLTTLFPAMNAADAGSISASWPKIMIDLFGDPVYGFTNIYAWMNLELFHITLWVIFGVFASLLASDVIAKEVEGKAIDILLSTPVTRIGMILSRTAGIIIIMIMTIFPSYLGCILGTTALGYPVKLGVLTIAAVLVLLISLVFAAVTIFISVFIPKQTNSAFLTITIFGIMSLYEDLAKLVPIFNAFTFVSPFSYYKPQDILIYSSFSFSGPLILLCIFTAITALSLITFSNKDIYL